MAHRIVTFAFVLALATASDALEWRIHTGTDLIGERFQLIESDTLDLTTEFRGQLQTRWTYDGARWGDVELDHRVGIGTQALRHDMFGNAVWQANNAWRVTMRGNSHARYYLDTADGSRSNFAQGWAQVLLQRIPEDLFGGLSEFDGSPTWGIDQGIEGTAYGNRSPVFLNGVRHWHGFVVDRRRSFDFFGGRCVLEHEHLPDSTALDYWGVVGDAYGTWSPSFPWDLSGDLSFLARRYREPSLRPHQTELDAHLRAAWRFTPMWSLEANPAFRLSRYDHPSSAASLDTIYYDAVRCEPAFELVWWPDWGSVRAGPKAGWQRSSTFRGEDYSQWGAQMGVNLFSLQWGFFDLTAEVGRRNYRYDEEALFSDYTFWDATLLLTGHLPWALQVDAFLILRSEYHRDALDNSRSVLLTVDLSRTLGR